ncbi:uncharacterized protein NESG_00588 [Nematocida ausubeli]|uniref:Homologous-pairing protein 2 winged helix domain-containing protein n=1 Tax=Nematocida ausubeli (strain ATCC PRA-371 / ERTm2) TaxID=1913371 RepID=A0A086J2S4_NEMA1|nr:uncharacterized protein NESG_00588 [Nematocida ausubeli]KFG26442.1 hypothetical protein NESG_00588 [Nematocida ausubeli]
MRKAQERKKADSNSSSASPRKRGRPARSPVLSEEEENMQNSIILSSTEDELILSETEPEVMPNEETDQEIELSQEEEPEQPEEEEDEEENKAPESNAQPSEDEFDAENLEYFEYKKPTRRSVAALITPKEPKETPVKKAAVKKEPVKEPVKKEPAVKKGAAKKETAKRIKVEDEMLDRNMAEIKKFIRERNEPLNTVEIVNNFQTGPFAMGQTTIRKLLLNLIQDKEIVEKRAGITAVYLPVHSEEDNNEETPELDVKLAEVKAQKEEIEAVVNAMRKEKRELLMYPADEVMKQEFEAICKELSIKQARIAEFAGSNRVIDPAEKKNLEKKLEEKVSLKKKVKKHFKNILDAVAEGANQRPADFLESIGITKPEC